MKKKYLIITLITLVLCITGCSKSNSNIENYLNSEASINSNAKDIMPTLDDLPKYQDIAYKFTHKSMLIFESDSIALIVKYDDKTYKDEKDKIAEKYIFLDQKVGFDAQESKYIIPEYEFSINSYTFSVVAGNGEDNTEFPKSFGMIGTSDEEKSIAYLYFYDTDLDYIGEKNDSTPMANFVKNYVDYNF